MIQFSHTYWAFLVVFMLVFTLAIFITGFLTKKRFSYNRDFRLALFTLIVFDIQVILGLFNYLDSRYFEGLKNGKFGEYMKVAHDRQAVMEHPVMMLIVLALLHYGYRRMKKAETSPKQYISIILFYGIGIILTMVRIPWHTWLN